MSTVVETENAAVHAELAAAEKRVRELLADAASTNIETRVRARTELERAQARLDTLTLQALETNRAVDEEREAMKAAKMSELIARLRKANSRMLPKLLALQADADEQDALVTELQAVGGPYCIDPSITFPNLLSSAEAPTAETWGEGEDRLPVWRLGRRDPESFLAHWVESLRQHGLLDE